MIQTILKHRALFCVAIVISFCPYFVHGETAIVNGITWTYVNFGNGVKIGNGSSDNNAVPASISGAIKIPSSLGGKPVVGVNEWAFRGCDGIMSVSMPDTITSIGKHAFDSCSSLKSVKIGDGVISIEQWAFSNCTSLEQVSIPASVTLIAENAFANCYRIQDVVFPGNFPLSSIFRNGYASIRKAVMVGSLTSIGDKVFTGCSNLEYLSIPDSVKSISNLTLKECSNLKEIILPPFFRGKIQDLGIAKDCVVRFRERNGEEDRVDYTEWQVTPEISEATVSDSLEQKFAKLAGAPADYETAKKFIDLAKSVGEGSARQILLQAAALAMLYARELDAYTRIVKPLMVKTESFEKSFRSKCSVCQGDGNEYEDCLSCHKTGRCPSPGCSGGRVEIRKRTFACGDLQPSTSYSAGSRKCSSCNGTGKCRYCNGVGKIPKPCRKCAGKGWIVTPSKVLEIYQKTIEDIPIVLYNHNLEYIDGKWMTPGSVRNLPFEVFQIFSPGQALCRDNTGTIFCLLYSAQHNRNLAEGEHYANDLYRCGTYSYITVQGAPSTVRQFSIDLETAERENRRQGISK